MAASISDLALENLDEKTQEPPKTRIKNAAEGRKCFGVMQQQDSWRGHQRARHQALLDGEPPLDPALLAAKGRQQTNVNWNDARAIMDGVEAGGVDMNVSVETLVYVPLIKAAVPDDELRVNFENILSEEVSKTIRKWRNYNYNFLNLWRITFWHGVGIAYFEDDIDWRFETTGLGDFVIPNGTKASEDKIPVAACLRWMELHELYALIQNEEWATLMGWNVDAVKKAILNATPEYRGTGWSQNNWMRIQQEMRSNDIGMSVSGRTAKVGVIHLWCREFDGTVSKYLTTVNPSSETTNAEAEPWLYYKPHIYQEMDQGMVFFTYSVGEHGTYHSISGLGRRIFPQGNALNRAMCTMLDAAVAGSGMFMQPLTESSMSKMVLTPIGGGLTLLPAKDHGEMVIRPVPDLAGGMQPIITDMRDTMGKRAGQFQGDGGLSSPVEKTRYQFATEMEALGKVGDTQINLWYDPWERILKGTVQRMCRPDYVPQWPGGKEVADLHRRLMLRGFPLQLLQAIDHGGVKAERAVGAGSGASRIGRLTQLKEYAGELGETGRYRLVRDLVAATLSGDYNLADRYIPREPAPLPPIDAQFATMENKLAKLGEEPVIGEGQMPLTHLAIHVPFLVELAEQANMSDTAMSELAEPMLILHTHCVDTLGTVQDSLLMEQEVAQYRQVIQQLGEIVQNAVRKVIAEQRKQAEAAGDGGGELSEGQLVMLQKAAEARADLEHMNVKAAQQMAIDEQKHQQQMRQAEEKFQQQKQLDDARTGAQMLRDHGAAKLKQRNDERLAAIKADVQKQMGEIKAEQARKAANKPKPKE